MYYSYLIYIIYSTYNINILISIPCEYRDTYDEYLKMKNTWTWGFLRYIKPDCEYHAKVGTGKRAKGRKIAGSRYFQLDAECI